MLACLNMVSILPSFLLFFLLLNNNIYKMIVKDMDNVLEPSIVTLFNCGVFAGFHSYGHV